MTTHKRITQGLEIPEWFITAQIPLVDIDFNGNIYLPMISIGRYSLSDEVTTNR